MSIFIGNGKIQISILKVCVVVILNETHFAIFKPLKNRAMSWSDACHGNPRALTTELSSTTSLLLLQNTNDTHIEESTGKY